ncbi:MAG TPA: hypothetical protein VMM60_06460 [Ilumatobacter sp.]|nr:hypothetical protein [Ilumatobacter sp.]
MHPEAAFLAGYSFSLILIAVGLERVGRCSTDPSTSRTLAASRPPTRRTSDLEPDWPHSEVPAFHLGLAAVALAAALVIATVSAVRNIGPVELIVHASLLALIGLRIRHVMVGYRTPTRQHTTKSGNEIAPDAAR